MTILRNSFMAFVALVSFASCTKYEGRGGKSSITGKVELTQKLYVNGLLTGQVIGLNAAKEDVYIVYGDGDLIYDDKTECNYDGTFIFDFLQPGTYTIFAYSEVFNPGPNIANNDDDYYTKEVVKQTVVLTKKSSSDIGTLTLIK